MDTANAAGVIDSDFVLLTTIEKNLVVERDPDAM